MSPSPPPAPGTTTAAESSGRTAPSRPRGPRLIEAHKQGWPRHAVHALIRSKLRGGVHRILAQGLGALRDALDADPSGVLFLANHSSWWDFFLAHWMNVTIPVDGYGMTDHANLTKFGFFRRIGAYSVERSDPASIRASLDYTARLLARPRAGVWLFPQGQIVCNDARPLAFQPGLRVLLKRAGRLRIVPAALRYEFWQDERMEVGVRFGEPAWVGPDQRADLLDSWRSRLESELDALKSDLLAQDVTRFDVVFRGKGSTHDRYHRIKSRLFGRRFNPS